MNKTVLLSLAAPIVAIIVWLFVSSSGRGPSQAALSKLTQTTPVRVDHETKRKQTLVSENDKTAENRSLTKHAELLAKAMTNDKRALMVDQLMKLKEPFYTELFAKWQLDHQTVGRVLEQVKRRESYNLELKADVFNSMTKVPTTQVSKIAADGLKEAKNAEEFDDVELIAILGPVRFEELKAIDRRVKSRLINMNAIDD